MSCVSVVVRLVHFSAEGSLSAQQRSKRRLNGSSANLIILFIGWYLYYFVKLALFCNIFGIESTSALSYNKFFVTIALRLQYFFFFNSFLSCTFYNDFKLVFGVFLDLELALGALGCSAAS